MEVSNIEKNNYSKFEIELAKNIVEEYLKKIV